MSQELIQKISINADLQVAGIKRGISEIESAFAGMKMDKGLESSLRKLKEDLAAFAEVAKKEIGNMGDAKNFEKTWNAVGRSLESVQKKLEGIKIDPKKMVGSDTINKLNEVKSKLVELYNTRKQKQDFALISEQNFKEADNAVKELGKNLDDLKAKRTNLDTQFETAKKNVNETAAEVTRLDAELKEAKKNGDLGDLPGQLEAARIKANDAKNELRQTGAEIKKVDQAIAQAELDLPKAKEGVEKLKQIAKEAKEASQYSLDLREFRAEIEKISGKKLPISNLEQLIKIVEQLTEEEQARLAPAMEKVAKAAKEQSEAVGGSKKSFQEFGKSILNSINESADFTKQVSALTNQVTHFFSLTNGWNLLKRAIGSAVEVVKELDEAMTGIAVVSEYDLTDIWGMRGDFAREATAIGVSTLDLVNATTLYTQQGLELNDAMKVAVETMKMGRIAGLEGEEATEKMTAALRGYNMELTEAQHVNDVYSNLAAKSASNQEQLATAMSKTASIAYNSGASFENMAAFLAQIIETTQEAPETAGTAMKTIIARFQELKKPLEEIGEVEGEVVDANKIETALRQAGVALRDANGEFRDFDDVILELSSKWNGLDKMTQRYIATMAAGSRQQSRFIALLDNNERLLELTGYAANSAGKSQEQFNKTLDSLQSKLAQMHNELDQFYTNIGNNVVVRTFVDLITKLIHAINSVIAPLSNSQDAFKNWAGALIEIIGLILSFTGALKVLRLVASKALAGIQINGGSLISLKKGKGLVESLATGFEALQDGIKSSAKAIKDFGLGAAAQLTGATDASKMKGAIGAGGRFITFLPKFLIAAAVLTAIVATIKEIDKQIYTVAEQEETYENAVKDTNTALQATVQAHDDLISKKNELKDLSKEFDLLTKGTNAWNDKLIEVNNKVLEIIEKFPELAQYMESDFSTGKLSISNTGMDKVIESLQNQQVVAQRMNLRAQRDQADFRKDQIEKGFYDAMNKLSVDRTTASKLLSGETNVKKLGWDPDKIAEVTSVLRDYNSQLMVQEANITSLNNALGNSYKIGGVNDVLSAQIAKIVETSTDNIQRSQNMSDLAIYGRAYMGKTQQLKDGGVRELQTTTVEIFREIAKKTPALATKDWNYAVKKVDDFADQVDDITTIRAFYRELLGEIPDDIRDNAEAMREAVLQAWLDKDIEEEVKNRTKAIKKLNKDSQNEIVKGMSTISGALEEDLLDPSEFAEKAKEWEATLGESFADLGYESAEKMAEAYEAAWLQQQEQLAKITGEILGVVLANGFSKADAAVIGAAINDNFSIAQRQQFQGISKKEWNTSQIKSIMNAVPFMTGDALDYTLTQLSQIDLSNSIEAARQLSIMSLNANDDIAALGKQLLASGKLAYGAGGQFKYLFNQLSSSEEASKKIQELLEKTGKLRASDLKELSKSFVDLQKYIDNTSVSLEGLAKLLELVQKGEITLDQINDTVIAALSGMTGWEGLVSSTSDLTKNFTLSDDSNDAFKFLDSAAKEINEAVEKGQWNNTHLTDYLDFLLKPGALEGLSEEERRSRISSASEMLNYISEAGSVAPLIEYMRQGLDIYGNKVGEDVLKGITVGIDEKGEYVLENIEGKSTEDLKNILSTALGISKDAAQLLITDYLQYADNDIKEQLGTADFKEGIQNAFGTLNKDFYEFNDSTYAKGDMIGSALIDKGTLSAIAKAYDKTFEETYAEMQKYAKENGIELKVTGFVDENGQRIMDGRQLLEEMSTAGVNYGDYTNTGRWARENGPGSNLIQAPQFDWSAAVEAGTQASGSIEQGTAAAQAEIDRLLQSYDQVKITTEEGIEVTLTADNSDALAAIEETKKQADFDAQGEAIAKALSNIELHVTTSDANEQIKETQAEAANLITDITNTHDFNLTTSNAWNKLDELQQKAKKAREELEGGSSGGGGGGGAPGKGDAYATGTPGVKKAGVALTGEEGPELIQRANSSTAYLTGTQGPEMAYLNKGDIVYNAEETKKIFSRGGQSIPRMAEGTGPTVDRYETYGGMGVWNIPGSDNGETPAAAMEQAADDTKEAAEEWKTSIDFLLRQTSRLEAYAQREELLSKERENLSKQYNNDLESLVTYHKALIQVYDQTESMNREILSRSRGELARLRQEYSNITKEGKSILDYFDVDEKNGLLPNYDLISQVTDETWGKQIEEAQSKFEDLLKKIWDAEKQIRDTQAKRIEELQLYEDITREIENKLIQAIVAEREAEIDKQESIYNAITEGNRQMLDALQQGISDARAQRDMDKQNQEIGESERRLALMSMDTSGANRLDILKEQQSLDDKRQSYTDSLIDKSIEQMERDAEKAAAQRDFQIELMRQQLEVAKKNEIPAEADKFIQDIGKDATRKAILEKLKVLDNFEEMGFFNRQNYNAEMTQNLNEVRTNLGTQARGGAGMTSGLSDFANSKGQKDNSAIAKTAAQTQALTLQYANDNAKRNEVIQKFMKSSNINTVDEAVARGIAWAMEIGGSGWSKDRITNAFGSAMFERVEQIRKSIIAGTTDLKGLNLSNKEVADAFKFKQFATGGIVNFTGPAWLDGTKSNPEYVLNADDTKRFFDLVDFTKDIGNDNNSTLIGDTYYNISMSNEIASDYDVDNMWDEMQRKIYENAGYRNVQALDFGRR